MNLEQVKKRFVSEGKTYTGWARARRFFRCEQWWGKEWQTMCMQKGFVDRLKQETDLEVEEVR